MPGVKQDSSRLRPGKVRAVGAFFRRGTPRWIPRQVPRQEPPSHLGGRHIRGARKPARGAAGDGQLHRPQGHRSAVGRRRSVSCSVPATKPSCVAFMDCHAALGPDCVASGASALAPSAGGTVLQGSMRIAVADSSMLVCVPPTYDTTCMKHSRSRSSAATGRTRQEGIALLEQVADVRGSSDRTIRQQGRFEHRRSPCHRRSRPRDGRIAVHILRDPLVCSFAWESMGSVSCSTEHGNDRGRQDE